MTSVDLPGVSHSCWGERDTRKGGFRAEVLPAQLRGFGRSLGGLLSTGEACSELAFGETAPVRMQQEALRPELTPPAVCPGRTGARECRARRQ